MRSGTIVAAALLAVVVTAADAPAKRHGKIVAGIERLLYVTNKSGIGVCDVNDSPKLPRNIDVPDSADCKSISASVQLGKLCLTSNLKDEPICLDLVTNSIDWRRHYQDGCVDSQAITPDGKTLYVPLRDGDSWLVIDTANGDMKSRIVVAHGQNYAQDDHPIGGVGPHNTWMNPDGSRVSLEVLTMPWVYVVATETGQIIGKAGPFRKGVRPFTVTGDEKCVFANVDWLPGFEVGEGRRGNQWGGKMLHRVEAKTPPSRLAQLPTPPARKPHSTSSHGINVRPYQKEV